MDDRLQQVSYTDAALQPLNPPTATVSYIYDLQRPRLTSMTDGTGTTSYGYVPINPADAVVGDGQLASVDGPLAATVDKVSYTYDQLRRVVGVTVDATAATESVILDALGRTTGVSNGLGNFVYGYVNQTGRLASATYPNNQTTSYTYWPNVSAAGTGNGDERLQTIWHKVGGATLSKQDYGYNVGGEITSWTQQADASPAVAYSFGYDPASELLSATRADAGSGAVQKQYTYRYDQAGNRTAEQVGAAEAGASYNNVNQLTARSGAGPMTFEGTVSEAAVVTVGGQAASIDASGRFKAVVNVAPGQQSVPIQATDASGNVTTKQALLTVTAGAPNQTLTYDLNGNLTGDGARTFTWDAESRLTSVTAGGHTYAWTYNGAGQRAAEKLDGVLSKQWVWDGMKPLVELNASNLVTKRFYAQGMVTGATLPATNTSKAFYTRDHLGSIREVTDSTGALLTRYDYDPYGRRTKLSGAFDADFGYTGYYVHAASGLYLTYYRQYDPDLARWLGRDPIGEEGGINLYGYVSNTPFNKVDPLGLVDWDMVGSGIQGKIGGAVGVGLKCQISKVKLDLLHLKGSIGSYGVANGEYGTYLDFEANLIRASAGNYQVGLGGYDKNRIPAGEKGEVRESVGSVCGIKRQAEGIDTKYKSGEWFKLGLGVTAGILDAEVSVDLGLIVKGLLR